MSEAHAADEPAHLTAHDFSGDRLQGLVRRALEKKVIRLGRAAEILGVGLGEMRGIAAGWVG